ncbi:unnamed protein product [Protopolystoma xenopodis]|uniref:Uncharacterized protein n=1 Tax=Protopolystoma xenopodis TaxID=117903 RepID=A0A448X5R4_9PLAT|nr:unnamed protein product [Protopolystoma xenopodis]
MQACCSPTDTQTERQTDLPETDLCASLMGLVSITLWSELYRPVRTAVAVVTFQPHASVSSVCHYATWQQAAHIDRGHGLSYD